MWVMADTAENTVIADLGIQPQSAERTHRINHLPLVHT
jgi:hypothetical protein